MYIDDTLLYTLTAVAVVIVSSILFFTMRKKPRKHKELPEIQETQPSLAGLPFKITRSITTKEATHAKDELRILGLEREILADAVRRLYEAHAEGKITEEERERLAQTYKNRMMIVREAISNDESVVALNELEAMQEDLIKLFSERFDELSGKIDELREKTETLPIKEIAVPSIKASQAKTDEEEQQKTGEGKTKKRRKPPTAKPTPRTEAEKRIEEIRSEIEEVLDRLGQMEVES